MQVRAAGLDDLHELSVFFLEAWKEAGPGAPGFSGATDDAIRELASEQSLRAKLTDPALRIFVAEDAGRVMGFASMKRIDSGAAEPSGIVVLQSLVGRGVGTELFNKVRKSGAAEGYRRVVVKTEIFNKTAIAFYRKLGFVETEETTEDVEGTEVRLMVLQRNLP